MNDVGNSSLSVSRAPESSHFLAQLDADGGLSG